LISICRRFSKSIALRLADTRGSWYHISIITRLRPAASNEAKLRPMPLSKLFFIGGVH
jgi:hypothetical protein